MRYRARMNPFREDSPEEIRRGIEAILRKHSGYDGPYADSTSIMDDLCLDSLDRVEIAMLVEEEFNLDIPDSDVERSEMGTFGGLAGYVQRKLAAG